MCESNVRGPKVGPKIFEYVWDLQSLLGLFGDVELRMVVDENGKGQR